MDTNALQEYLESRRQQMLADLAALIAVESVRGEAEPGKPYGAAPYEALQTALAMAERDGFLTKNHEGYVGTVEYNQNKTELAVFAHLDVVAAGDGWHTDPYRMQEKDGILYGRGVSDDKGPAIAAYYAMRALKALGVRLRKNVRLVLGTDEECGSSDLAYYLKKESAPPWSFTPDANFPVINGEKGRFSPAFHAEYPLPERGVFVKSLNAGTASNAVPAFCEAVVCGCDDALLTEKAEAARQATGASFAVQNGEIVCRGTAAHASLPELGNNPITAMLWFLASLPLAAGDAADRIRALHTLFPHGDWRGESFGVQAEDQLGALTLSLNILHLDGGGISGQFDARTPMCATQKTCAEKIDAAMRAGGLFLDTLKMTPAHYVDAQSPFVQTLLRVYEQFTGEPGECLSMGGGTYVHNIEGGTAFGAIRKDLNTNMHGADEFMYTDDLITAAKIYACVIAEVCGVEHE